MRAYQQRHARYLTVRTTHFGSRLNQVCDRAVFLFPTCSCEMMAESSVRPSAGGVARRRRERRLRSWWRHEQQTVRMALAAATHHSAQQNAAPRGPKTGARAREGVEHEQHDGLRAQKPPLPGVRPGSLFDPGPQRSDRTVRRSAGDGPPDPWPAGTGWGVGRSSRRLHTPLPRCRCSVLEEVGGGGGGEEEGGGGGRVVEDTEYPFESAHFPPETEAWELASQGEGEGEGEGCGWRLTQHVLVLFWFPSEEEEEEKEAVASLSASSPAWPRSSSTAAVARFSSTCGRCFLLCGLCCFHRFFSVVPTLTGSAATTRFAPPISSTSGSS